MNNLINRALVAKKKLFTLFAALMLATAMWAAYIEGPWTYQGYLTGNGGYGSHCISFLGLNNTKWSGNIEQWHKPDEHGIGFTYYGDSENDHQLAIFSYYSHSEKVPSYTRKRMNWEGTIKACGNRHFAASALYAWDNINDLNYSGVDFSEDFSGGCGTAYRIAAIRQRVSCEAGDFSHSFDFDNRSGADEQTKNWYLLLTHVIGCNNGYKSSNLDEWGSFKHRSLSWENYYYKYINFEQNGGSGTIPVQEIENSGKLAAINNAITRSGFVFNGWNTKADGSGTAIADQAAMTATENDKGRVTLYAQWMPVPVNYKASFDQTNRTVTIVWRIPEGSCMPGKFAVYRGNDFKDSVNIMDGTVEYSFSETNTPAKSVFPYESTLTYDVYFVPKGSKITDKQAAVHCATAVNTTRVLPIRDCKMESGNSTVAITWTSDRYPVGWGNAFEIYIKKEGEASPTLVQTITPVYEGQNTFRWEHRSVTSHDDRQAFFTNSINGLWYVEEPIDPCTTHTYIVKSVIDKHTCATETFSRAAITEGTKFISCDASKAEYSGKIDVSWKVKPQNLTQKTYRIERRRAESKTDTVWTMLDSVKTDSENYTYTDAKVSPGVFYRYKVTVIDKCGNGKEYTNTAVCLGFVRTTGIVEGSISYGESKTAVSGVQVEAKLTNGEQQDAIHQFYSAHFSDTSSVASWSLPGTAYASSVFNNAFSIQMWVSPDSPGRQKMVDCGGWSFGMAADNSLCVIAGKDTCSFSSLTLNAGAYTHLTLTRSGNTLTVYKMKTDNNGLPDVESQECTLKSNLAGGDTLKLGGFKGYIDEFRLWTKALTANEIKRNYDRTLVGNESRLETYWTFDEGLNTEFFDYSHTDVARHNHHGKYGNHAKPDLYVPTDLALKAVTDDNGHYVINGIPFVGEGSKYMIIPSLGTHRFSPTNHSCFLKESNTTYTGQDFVDNSSFTVSGTVYYKDTDCPVEGCQLYVDNTICKQDTTPVCTNAEGEFTINVPIGEHLIEVRKDGHTIVAANRQSDGARMVFDRDMEGLPFYDKTLVNLTGRIAGGNVESGKKIGFGLSRNTIGMATVTLRHELNTYHLNTADSVLKVASASPDTIRSKAWRGTGEQSGKLFIRTDSLTGEFSAMVPPLSYVVERIYVASSDLDLLNAPVTLNLTNALEQHADSVPETKQHYYYHTLLQYNHHSQPVFSVRQNGHPDGSFGISTYDVNDALGLMTVNDIYSVSESGTVTYKYGGPLFVSLDKYRFDMEGYERFVNMDRGDSVVTRVPLANAAVRVDNALSVNPTSVSHQLQLDSAGKATYIWQAGMPHFATPYTQTLTVSYKLDNEFKTGLSLAGIVLGASPTGNNFVTAGPADIDMVLRDPPGSQSFATWTKGTVTTTKTINSIVDTNDTTVAHVLNLRPTFSFAFGSNSIASGEAGGGLDIALGGHSDKWEWTSSNTYTKSVSFSEAFSTSDNPEYDGADGDIFIGTATNIIVGEVRELGLFRNTQNPNTVSLYEKDNYAQGISFPTAFAYSQYEIIHSLIPDLINVRNSFLTVVPDTGKINENESYEPIYVTQLQPDNPHFGDSATYKQITPKNPLKKHYTDTISSLNMQIKAWRDALADNEKEKVEAAKKHDALLAAGKMTNRSFDAGSSVTENTTVETDTVYTEGTFHSYLLQLKQSSTNTGGISIFGIGYQKKQEAHYGKDIDNKTETETTHNASFSYTLKDNDPGDVISVDVYTNQGHFKSPIFHTRAGKTSNPYEGEVVAQYYQPQQKHVIMDATMQVEVPSIGVVKPTLYDIPSGSPASYELHLANLSDAGADCTFRLIVADETNPLGAALVMDGRPITDNNRLITIPHGQTIVKTLQLKQGDPSVLHYENIAIILASQVQSDPTSNMAIIADTAYITAQFVPSASPITLSLNMTTMNTQTGTDLVLTMRDFDRAYYRQKAFRLQYKPQGGDWITFHEYVLRDEDMTGISELLPAEGASISYTLPMKNQSAGLYRFRIVSVSTFGTDEIYLFSNELELTKNLNRPRPLGFPEPADGILDIGDELSITFNEEFVSGELTRSKNFLITGVLNGAPIEHQVALRLYENALAAQTEATVNLSNRDFSLDMWVNMHSNGLLLSHGTAKDLQVSTDAQGHLMIQIEESTLVSESVLPHDKWLFLTLSYHHEATQGLLSASVAYDDVTEPLFLNRPVAPYMDRGPIFIGGGAAGAIHELLLWDEAHDIAVALAQRSVTKNPATQHLIGYWKMNEGEGKTVSDYSRNRHMNTTDANWYLNNVNKALTLDGTHHFATFTGDVPPMPTDDYAAELWFKAGKQNGEAQLFQLGEVGLYIDTNGKLHLQSGANDQIINHKFEILNNSWHHVLFNVHRFGTAAVYVDGERALTVSADKIGDLASDSLRIGLRRTYVPATATMQPYYRYDRPFQGTIDEVRLWQATLQSDMLAANRKQRLRGDEPGLSLYYPFEKKSLDEYNQVIVSGTMEEFTGHGEEAVISGQPSAISYSDDAPALKEKPTETNVAFTFTASNTKIVIDIDEEPARIEGCMLNITVRDVRSNTGNYSLPATWTAFVHRNELAWTDNELSAKQENGEQTTLSTVLINRSGTPQRWTLSELPAWLTVNATSGMLNPLQQQSLAFRVSASAPIGKHELTVYAMGNNGIETPLTLHITITGNLPNWTINPADYENSMSIVAQLDFFGEISEDEDDIVAAFIGDECRGIAQPEYKERYDAYYLTMTIYGDTTTAKKPVSFRAYKASTGVLYTQVAPQDTVFFKPLMLIGSYKEPVVLSVQDRIEQRLALRQGWNWISLSVEADDMTPQAILRDIENDVIAIKGHQDETQGIDVGFMTHTDTGWVGYMEPLLNRRSYMIKAKRDCELRIVGTSVEPATHTVRIHSNWGWPGYFGQHRIALADAFADADPQPGDIVRTKQAAAYYDDYEWVGSLQALEPGQGYAYYSVTNEEKWFAYPSSSVAAAPRRNAKMVNDQMVNDQMANDFAYPYNMILVGQVLLDNEPAANARIAVFDGDECRSIGYTDDDGNLLMLVAGEDEATLSYKLILNDQVFETVQTLHYVTDAIVGTPDSPHLIRFGEGQGIGDVQGDNVRSTKVLIDGILYIERNGEKYDTTGKRVSEK